MQKVWNFLTGYSLLLVIGAVIALVVLMIFVPDIVLLLPRLAFR